MTSLQSSNYRATLSKQVRSTNHFNKSRKSTKTIQKTKSVAQRTKHASNATKKMTHKINDILKFIRIYRKTVSNLKIRDYMLRSVPSEYQIGPTIIWTEVKDDLSIFTSAESYKNYIGFEDDFAKTNSKYYLPKILKSENMRMTKGTILIKEKTEPDEMNIPVHFCAYRIDKNGKLKIFDPSWHKDDPGIYSTTAFYASLVAFKIKYQHAEYDRKHHWQSLLLNDVFCQTWTLQWLYSDVNDSEFSLPLTRKEASEHVTKYIKQFSEIILLNIENYMALFPAFKLEGQDPNTIFKTLILISNNLLSKRIQDMF